MNKNDQNYIAQKIRTQYMEKESTELDELKALDAQVKRPAVVFAYIFGIVGALILGTGMCLAMEVIGSSMVLGIIIGVVGILLVSINYPIYKAILDSRRAKYADRIIALSDKLMSK